MSEMISGCECDGEVGCSARNCSARHLDLVALQQQREDEQFEEERLASPIIREADLIDYMGYAAEDADVPVMLKALTGLGYDVSTDRVADVTETDWMAALETVVSENP